MLWMRLPRRVVVVDEADGAVGVVMHQLSCQHLFCPAAPTISTCRRGMSLAVILSIQSRGSILAMAPKRKRTRR
jgi:hypothetical protein